METKKNLVQEALSAYEQKNFLTMIERLAGGKDNLRIDIQNVKFILGDQKVDINGSVNFNVVHKNPNAHVVLKQEIKKNV
jgi:hypothetical protein